MEDEPGAPHDPPGWNGPPPAVDPALWAEFQLVSDRVHELNHMGEYGGLKSPRRRVMIELPEEWVLLFAWIARRYMLRSKGWTGPTQYTPETMETLGLSRIASRIVRPHISDLVAEYFIDQLHSLCTGRNFLWSNKDMGAEAAAKAERAADMAKFNTSGEY